MRKQMWAGLAVALALLGGCGNDDDGAPVTDSEDYTGSPQAITAKRVDEPVYGTRTKYKTERYCVTKKSNGTCKTWGTKQVANGTETYETDDRDWVLVLADGTEVDVDQAEYDRYQIGAVYP